MNNITNNGNGAKKSGKFNVVDFLIILIAVAIIAVFVYAVSPWSQIKKLLNQDEVNIQYVVEIRGVDKEFCNLIKDKDAVIDNVTKKSLGKVSSVESIDVSTELNYQIDENNNISGILVEDPQKYDITLVITANAEYEENVGYTVNGCRIAVGEQMFFRFPKYNCSGYCVAISDSKS